MNLFYKKKKNTIQIEFIINIIFFYYNIIIILRLMYVSIRE